ncbi:MAG: ankyrin repeat domain-containing protein [Thermoanaerobaculia bacterium]
MNRRLVLKAGALTGAGIAVGAVRPLFAQTIPDRGPRLDLDLVQEFVRVAHGDLEKTTKMLEAQPALVNATWDWGGGDWETGLGGASHMGNRAIAEHLLSRGARMDVFCATMLGKIEIVKAFLADDPKVVDLAGPHRIPLIRHAVAGKQDALVELLKAHGAKA